VTVHHVRGPVEAADALLQGTADLSATTLEALARRGSGETGPKVRLAFGLTAAPPLALLASLARPDPARAVAALAGQKIGLGAPGPEQTWLVAILAHAKLDGRTVRLESQSERDLRRALEKGELSAALVAEPLAAQLLAGGQVSLLADLRTPRAAAEALDKATVDAAVFARTDRLPSATALAAFGRAILAAERRLAEGDVAALASRLPASLTARPEEFAARVAAVRELYLPEGAVSVTQVRATLALVQDRMPLSATARFPKASELIIAPAR